MKIVRAMTAALLFAGVLSAEPIVAKIYDGKPLKVLLATGGCCHDYKKQGDIIPALLKTRGNFEVEVIGPDLAAVQEALRAPDWAAGYDAVIYNLCDANQTDAALIHNIAKVHTEGTTAAVMVHCALHSYHWKMGTDRTKYEEEEWLKVTGIASGNHGPKAPITVTVTEPTHPIMQGLPKGWTTPKGELYNAHEILPTVTPLATGDNGNKKQGEQVCIWVNQCEKTRIFGTSMGHHNETMQQPVYGDLLTRGLLWACDRLPEAEKPEPRKICLVAGKDSHGRDAHAHGPGLHFLRDELTAHAPGVEVALHKGGWPQDPAFFEGADAIVIYCDGGRRHVTMNHRDALDTMAAAGVGIGCIHYAVEMPKGEPGDALCGWIGGYFETHWSVNPHWTADFTTLPTHAVTQGLSPFQLHDEWYFHMRFNEGMKGVAPLLSAVPPESTITRKDGPHSNNPTVREEVKAGVPQHVAWVTTREDGGRGFGVTGGHFHKSWQEDNFRKLVLNAILWIAHEDVPEGGVPSPTPSDVLLESYLNKYGGKK